MSKQDIEKRLGFAAQGVKETTRTNAKAKFVRFMDLETWKNSKGTVFTAGIEDDAGRFQPYVTARDSSGGDQLQTRSAPTFKTEQGARKWLNTWLQNNKSTSSRPGVKAKMAAPANWESKLDAKNLADSFNVEGLRELLGSAKEIARKYPQYKALGQKMADGINMILSAVKQMKAESIKASRLGVKAKMAKPQFRTKKLHNGYIAVEVNQGSGWERYDTTHEESWNGIEEYERGYQKAYDRGLRYSGGAWRIPSTTASRPGVKAKFDLTGMELYSRIVPTINSLGRFVEVQAPRFKQNIADAAKYVKKAFDLGEKIFQSNTASPQEIREFERQVSVAKALPGWRIANSENFSRPGVKAKFADAALNQIRNNAAISDKILTLVSKGLSVPQAIDSVLGEGTYKRIGSEVYDELKKAKSSRPGVKAKMGSSQVNDSATTADLIREAQRLRDVIKTSNREFDKTHLRQIKQELDKRGVLMPYGASEVLASRSGMKAKA